MEPPEEPPAELVEEAPAEPPEEPPAEPAEEAPAEPPEEPLAEPAEEAPAEPPEEAAPLQHLLQLLEEMPTLEPLRWPRNRLRRKTGPQDTGYFRV